MFNLSIQISELPDTWRVVSVTPIFKKGSPSDPANYRPISLTCVACKLLETGIKTSLLNHLLRNNVISSSQPGNNCDSLIVADLIFVCDLDYCVNSEPWIDLTCFASSHVYF